MRAWLKTRQERQFAILICASIVVGLVIRTTWTNAAPRIHIDRTVIDFGRVPLNHPCLGDFSLSNEGTLPLEVLIREVSCTCTVVDLPVEPLLPGESRSLKAVIRASGAEGGFGSKIVLATNDPAAPEIILGLRGEGVTLLAADPPAIYLGVISADSLPKSSVVELVPGKLGNERTITDCEVQCDNADILFSTSVSDGRLRIATKLGSTTPIGIVRSMLRVKTRHPVEGELIVPIAAEVTGAYSAVPSGLVFKKVKVGSSSVHSCNIIGLNESDRIDVEPLPTAVADLLDVEITRHNRDARIEVTARPQGSSRFIDSEIRIKISAENGNAVFMRIPVMISVEM